MTTNNGETYRYDYREDLAEDDPNEHDGGTHPSYETNQQRREIAEQEIQDYWEGELDY